MLDFLHVALPYMRQPFRAACRRRGWTMSSVLRDRAKLEAVSDDPSVVEAYYAALRIVATQCVDEAADELGIPRTPVSCS